MSIRVLLCFAFVIGFSIYAYRNWFGSLIAAILLMAVVEHPDMPKSIGGIPGLNPWNFLMANVLIAWWRNRWKEGAWDMPRFIVWMAIGYAFVILVGFARLAIDDSEFHRYAVFEDYSFKYAVTEYLINCFKWVLPGILLFDGCRNRRRTLIALASVLAVYFLLALQTIKHMPLNSVNQSGADLSRKAGKVLVRNVGYHRVNLSMMFSGASWAVLTTLVLIREKKYQLAVIGVACSIALAQALTGGRTGYVTWALLGVVLALVRWRRFLPIIPLAILAVVTLLPSVRERMLMGFGGQSGAIAVQSNDYEITAGRTLAWARVIPAIGESPFIGYGRQAMVRTGIYGKMLDAYGEADAFPHPHNAYLELLLDNGFFGFAVIIPFYLVFVWYSFRLLLDRTDPLFAAVGGTACALILAFLIAGIGSQTFYPREGAVGMWCAMGLVLRLSLERAKTWSWGTSLFDESASPEDELRDEVSHAQPA
jgi:O-antigen ligase